MKFTRYPWVLGALLLAAPMLPRHALAQASAMGGAGSSQTVTIRALVVMANPTSHLLEVRDPSGAPLFVTYDPTIAGAERLKQGDVIVLHYHQGVSFVLSGPGTPLPRDSLTTKSKSSEPGAADPRISAHERLVVTGRVVGVDPSANTISLAPPDGGRVEVLPVTDPQMQARLPRVKVGDTLTAIFTRGAAVGIEQAQ
jgi:hypothetical protein